jgi:hypothetical protein
LWCFFLLDFGFLCGFVDLFCGTFFLFDLGFLCVTSCEGGRTFNGTTAPLAHPPTLPNKKVLWVEGFSYFVVGWLLWIVW